MVFEMGYAIVFPGLLLLTLNTNTYGEPEEFAKLLEDKLERKMREEIPFEFRQLSGFEHTRLAGRREGSWCVSAIISYRIEIADAERMLRGSGFKPFGKEQAKAVVLALPDDLVEKIVREFLCDN